LVVNTHTPFRVGLTGGIGSGKSTVASILRDLGITVIDADGLSRSATDAGGPAIEAIKSRFGPRSIASNGAMDRDFMRQLVFDQPEERLALQAIVHPHVLDGIEQQALSCGAKWVVLDLPLLCESPRWRTQLRWIWVVDCAEETQIQRVMARSGWGREQILAVMSSQCNRDERLALADAVIPNEGIGLEELSLSVRSIVSQFGL
jgi:dephospho-CoA kinase